MSEGLPKISIIMPVLNREATIEKAIQSVIQQNYPKLEFIILDGASTDGTVSIIKQYERHLAYWHSQPDGSPVRAVNLGIQKATGDLVVLFMSDDWYEPDILARIGKAYQLHPEADMFTCGGQIVRFDAQSGLYVPTVVYDSRKRMALNLQNICLDVTSAICCRFIRRTLYEKIGDYWCLAPDGKYMLSNDKEFLIRAVLYGAKDVYVDYVGHHYLASPLSSTFGKHQKNILRLCVEHRQLIDVYLQKETLSVRQRYFFHYWYLDQSVRLFLFELLAGQFKAAVIEALKGVKRYGPVWPAIFPVIVLKIIGKKCWRASHRLYACS